MVAKEHIVCGCQMAKKQLLISKANQGRNSEQWITAFEVCLTSDNEIRVRINAHFMGYAVNFVAPLQLQWKKEKILEWKFQTLAPGNSQFMVVICEYTAENEKEMLDMFKNKFDDCPTRKPTKKPSPTNTRNEGQGLRYQQRP